MPRSGLKISIPYSDLKKADEEEKKKEYTVSNGHIVTNMIRLQFLSSCFKVYVVRIEYSGKIWNVSKNEYLKC
jgi:hypothetical protein